ncbi:MAG: DUF4236 domain-containing protein [Desulfovibrio sp.]|nr:DUF4236 domain-containing protein [Desulfovibrio sp.]
MGLRFHKKLKIFPGLSVNLSKSGMSLTVGKPGACLNLSKRGSRMTVGLPGTGLSYSKFLSSNPNSSTNHRSGNAAPVSLSTKVIICICLLLFLAWCCHS